MAHLEWTDDAGHVVAIRFDSVRSVEHNQTALVTQHPIEKGADISDHIRPELPVVTVSGVVSNLPLFAVAELASRDGNPRAIGSYRSVDLPKPPFKRRVVANTGAVSDLRGALGGGDRGTVAVEALVFDDLASRVREITTLLTEAFEASRLIKFLDEARDYENMAMESKAIVRTAEGGKACSVTLTLKQINVVSSQLVDAPVPAELRGQLTKAAGSVAAKAGANATVDEKKREQVKSAAASIGDGGVSAVTDAFRRIGIGG